MRVSVLVSMLLMSHGAILQSAVGMEIVAQCACGEKREHTLTLLRDHGVGSTFVFYLSRNGAAPTLLYGSDEEQSRGDDIEVGCVGRHERGLVISGTFASNYIKGTALRFNTRRQRWERVDFAERVRPVSLYFRASGLEVLIPNSGRNESPMRYIIYRYDATIDAARQRYSDSPPRARPYRFLLRGTRGMDNGAEGGSAVTGDIGQIMRQNEKKPSISWAFSSLIYKVILVGVRGFELPA